MSQIRSKVHNYGSDCESKWPSKYGTGDKTPMYIDAITGELKPGYPPPPEKFGEAPIVQFDSMPKTFHEGACREVESRKEWNRLDKEHGCITFANQAEAERPLKKRLKEEKKEYKQGLRKASSTALQMHRENPKEMKERVQKQREVQESIAKQENLTKPIENAVSAALKGKIK